MRKALTQRVPVVLATALLLMPSPTPAAAADTAGLREDTRRAAADLRRGTEALQSAQARLRTLQLRAAQARDTAEAAQDQVTATRARLRTVVGAAYRSPVPDDVLLVMTVGPDGLRDALAARSDLEHVQGDANTMLESATEAGARARAQEAEAAALTAQARTESRRVQRQVAALRARASRAQRRLSAAAQALERPSAGSCTGGSTAGLANGFLPPDVLCPIGRGQFLRADAAEAFLRLNAARPQCVTDAYRPYGEQVRVYRQTPQLAAVPGTSRHGLGLALDLGCGVQRFDSDAYRWLKENAGRFGWVHPSWAEPDGAMPEPWHWEFVG